MRWAITCSNATVLKETISLPTALVVEPTSPLPTITQPVDIVGTLDGSGRPLARIDGSSNPTAAYGLVTNIASLSLSSIKYVWMSGWKAAGADALKLQGSGPVAVTGSLFGADAASVGVQGNYVGIELGNSSPIGGEGVERNTFSGNVRGIQVNGGGCGTVGGGCAISGNFIGTALNGTSALGNTESGIRVENAYAAISGNVISGNKGDGIRFVGGGSGGSVTANSIGTTTAGALGNAGAGVSIEGASGLRIGSPLGVSDAATLANANTIANNTRGVTVISGSGQVIRGNRIFGNKTLDIDLANDGPTANDPGDSDPGANNRQNYPVLSAATLIGSTLTTSLTLDSTAGAAYTVDFYAGPDGPDNDCGAGSRGLKTSSTWLGSTSVVAGPSSQTVALQNVTQARGTVVATATSASGDTSELSGCQQFVNRAPTAANVTVPGPLLEDQTTPVSFTLTATDFDGPYTSFSFAIDAPPTKGTVTLLSSATCSGTTCTQSARYLPAADQNGPDSFTFHASDGTYASAPATGSVSITPVNDAPSFTKGADQVILEGSGPQSVAWATAVSAGPANESDQSVGFQVSNSAGDLFDVQPAIASDGVLTYALKPDANTGDGFVTVTVAAKDTGGTSNGGIDTSPPQTFTITVAEPIESIVSLTPSTTTPCPAQEGGLLCVQAGARQVPFSSVAPSRVAATGSGVSATPVNEIPVNDIPINEIPVNEIAMGTIPINEIGLTDVTQATDPAAWEQLRQTLLSTLPVARGWGAILSGTPLADRVLQNVSLADVLSNDAARLKFESVPLSEFDFSHTPLGSLTAFETIMGSFDLSQIPLEQSDVTAAGVDPVATLQSWCDLLNTLHFACIDGASLSGQTVLSTSLQGAPLNEIPVNEIPVNDIPINEIPLNEIPVNEIPVNEIGLGGTPVNEILLGATPVNEIRLADLPVNEIPVNEIPVNEIPVNEIPVNEIDLSKTSLGSIPVNDVALASSPVNEIPVNEIATPGAVFTCGTSCTGTIGDNAGHLKPGVTWAAMLGALKPSTVVPYWQLMASLDRTYRELFGSISADALAGVTLSQILGADALGANPDGIGSLTLLQLLKSLDLTKVTLGDLLAAFLKPQSFDWESLDLAILKPQSLEGVVGGILSYDARITLTKGITGMVVSTKATVTLPGEDDFVFLAGSATLTPVGDNDPTHVVKLADPAAGAPLEWTMPLTAGTTYILSFDVKPGITLGTRTTGITVTPLNSERSTGASANAPVVVVGDTFENNDSYPTTSTDRVGVALDTSSFFLSYIRKPGDVDFFTFKLTGCDTVPTGDPCDPEGTRVSFRLGHLPEDYDLTVYGPADPLGRSDGSTPPLDAHPLADATPTLTHDAESLPVQTLDDIYTVTPPAGQALIGLSSNRGTDADAVTVISQGHGESFTIQVSGFNGASSDAPYMLRATKKAPPELTCDPRFVNATIPGPAGTEAILPSSGAEPNTLFVVNTQQLKLAYPTDAATALSAVRGAPGAFPSSFPAAVLQVDNRAEVQEAYGLWNACPASAALANDVVTQINDRIAAFREAHPSVKNVVLVGGDGITPFARLDDFTTVANEGGYDNSVVRSSYLAWGEKAGMLLSDDPYASTSPVRFFTRELYLPTLAVGRLVETPAQIQRQIAAFQSAGGVFNAATSLTTGYDFLNDGAAAVNDAFGPPSGITTSTLIGDDWDRSDLLGALKPTTTPPSIVSLNAHADFYAFQPAVMALDGAITDTADPRRRGLVTTDDVLSSSSDPVFSQRLIFSMGCHAGLNIEDAFLASGRAKDWAEAFASTGALAFVGNTGFGYGDTDLVAYSEDLARRFAAHAVGGLTLGQSLALAKQDYAGGLGVFGVYDEKAMSELALYGLPMWKLASTGSAAQAAATATAASAPTAASASVLDPLVGLKAQPFEVTSDPVRRDIPGKGSYWSDGNDPQQIGVQVTHFRPIQPRQVLPVEIANAHGALITGLTSRIADSDVDPVYARPVVDNAAAEPELAWDGAVFPAKLQALTSTRDANGDLQRQLVLMTGQFTGFPSENAAPSPRGQQVVFDSMSALVYGAPAGNSRFAQPSFRTVGAQRVLKNGEPDSVSFAVDVAGPDGRAVKRVVAAYDYDTDSQTGQTRWKFVDLVLVDGVWRGMGPLQRADFHYFVQAVSEDGTVGVTMNKGLYYDPKTTIDVSQITTNDSPSIVIGSPSVASGGSVYLTGDVAVASYVCLDPDSVVDPCAATVTTPGGSTVDVPPGGALPTDQAGTYTFTVTATVNGVAAASTSVTYTVAGIKLSGTGGDNGWYTSDVAVSIDGAPAGAAGLTLTVDGGPQTLVTTDGVHTARLELSSGGTTSVRTLTISRDATKPAIAFSPASGGQYTLGATVTVDVTCTDATAGIAACSPSSTVTLATGQVGTFSFTATAKDKAGNTQSTNFTHTVVAPNVSLLGKVVFSRSSVLWSVDPFATSGSGPTLLYAGATAITQPAVSPDGGKLAFVQGGDLYVRTSSGAVYPLTSTSSVNEDAPAWSADGTKLAFNSTGTYGGVGSRGQDVWVAALTVGTAGASLSGYLNVTSTNGDDVWPSWSPAGTEIVFTSNRSKGSYKLYKVALSSLVQTRVTIGSNDDIQPAWSPAVLPGGQRIAFSSNFAGGTGGFEIHLVLPVADSSKTRITTNDGTDGQPIWITSTTGQIRILFVSELGFAGAGGGLYRMSPDGSGITKIPGTTGLDTNPG